MSSSWNPVNTGTDAANDTLASENPIAISLIPRKVRYVVDQCSDAAFMPSKRGSRTRRNQPQYGLPVEKWSVCHLGDARVVCPEGDFHGS